MHDPSAKVLAFDVFGTVVDWHGSIVREMAQIAPHVDGPEFARAWRAGYAPAMQQVMQSGRWRIIDDLHRYILNSIAGDFGLDLDEQQMTHLNEVWHRLDPWPDSVEAIRALARKYTVVSLSNGNLRLLTNMAKRAGIPWDCILSAEVFRAYKPDRRTYLGVASIFAVEPGEVMMVAAHHNDLDAAADAGLQTAYVERPLEFGVDQPKDVAPQPRHPRHVTDLGQLAAELGCATN